MQNLYAFLTQVLEEFLCNAFLNSSPSFMAVKSSINWKKLPKFGLLQCFFSLFSKSTYSRINTGIN